MAVYDRSYRPYDGPLTTERWRFLILARFAYHEIAASKIASAFSIACFLPLIVAGILIYLHHNLAALEMLPVSAKDLVPIDASFFMTLMILQCFFLGFLQVLLVGPGLVSADLTNNALPLYLSRPFSRTEYIAGKASVIAILLSISTWIPGLALVLFQTSLVGVGWLVANLRVALAIFVGCWIWIVVLSLITLALSAHVKRKALGQAALFGVFFVSAAMPAWIAGIFRTDWGSLLSIPQAMSTVWTSLYGVAPASDFPLAGAWVTLIATAFLSLVVLARRLKAYEVFR